MRIGGHHDTGSTTHGGRTGGHRLEYYTHPVRNTLLGVPLSVFVQQHVQSKFSAEEFESFVGKGLDVAAVHGFLHLICRIDRDGIGIQEYDLFSVSIQ